MKVMPELKEEVEQRLKANVESEPKTENGETKTS